MNLNEEIYKAVDHTIYDQLGGVIFHFEDLRKKDDHVGILFLDEGYVLPYINNDTMKQGRVFVHILWLDNGVDLPMAYYNVGENEQTLISQKRSYPEIAKVGYYRTWRFVSEKFKNIQGGGTV